MFCTACGKKLEVLTRKPEFLAWCSDCNNIHQVTVMDNGQVIVLINTQMPDYKIEDLYNKTLVEG